MSCQGSGCFTPVLIRFCLSPTDGLCCCWFSKSPPRDAFQCCLLGRRLFQLSFICCVWLVNRFFCCRYGVTGTYCPSSVSSTVKWVRISRDGKEKVNVGITETWVLSFYHRGSTCKTKAQLSLFHSSTMVACVRSWRSLTMSSASLMSEPSRASISWAICQSSVSWRAAAKAAFCSRWLRSYPDCCFITWQHQWLACAMEGSSVLCSDAGTVAAVELRWKKAANCLAWPNKQLMRATLRLTWVAKFNVWAKHLMLARPLSLQHACFLHCL